MIPATGRFFKNRKEAVTAPVDLVPPEVQETEMEMLGVGRSYALTFANCRRLVARIRPLANAVLVQFQGDANRAEQPAQVVADGELYFVLARRQLDLLRNP